MFWFQNWTLGTTKHTCCVISFYFFTIISLSCYDNTAKASARRWTRRGVSAQTNPHNEWQIPKGETTPLHVWRYETMHTSVYTRSREGAHTLQRIRIWGLPFLALNTRWNNALLSRWQTSLVWALPCVISDLPFCLVCLKVSLISDF